MVMMMPMKKQKTMATATHLPTPHPSTRIFRSLPIHLTFPALDNASNYYNNSHSKPISVWDYDKLKNCSADTSKQPSSLEYLTYFNCGRVKVDPLPDGKQQVTREFTLMAMENQSIPIAYNGLKFDNAWTFNGTIPGPTMRVTEGDLVKITVVNSIGNKHSHSIHMHSIHEGDMDGIEERGAQ